MLQLTQELYIICNFLTFHEYQNLKFAIDYPLSKHTVNQKYYFESIIGNWTFHPYDYWRLLEYSKHDYSKWMSINKSLEIDYNTLVLKLAHLNQFTELKRIDLRSISSAVRARLLDFELGDTFYLQILKLSTFDQIKSSAVKFACWYGYNTSIDYLLTMDLDFTGGLTNASSKGYLQLVIKVFDKTSDIRDALFEAALHNHMHIVEFFVTQDINSDDLSNAFITAVVNRHVDIVKLLLEDERVDPNWNNMTALTYACECGFVDIVELLLDDHRVAPSACDNKAIKLAKRNNHYDIVGMIEKDPRYVTEVDSKYSRIRMKLPGIKKFLPRLVMAILSCKK
ncbi:hypothetical protein HDV01_005405 [Terramyces sp. JEL0728]|nr:hypothetical protein HDV01_005405 [Terramyces sp. JEL0728]